MMYLNKKIQDLAIASSATILEVLKHMDKIDKKLLLVFNANKFEGLVSIGDIQRAIIKNSQLSSPVKEILRSQIRVASSKQSMAEIKQVMQQFRIECMPVLDENSDLVDVIFWDDLFQENSRREPANLNLPVVIMAGGFGTRLKPITNILPKPLIPLGEKTMIEHIMDNFLKAGCSKFLLSVNYKSEIIKYYFNNERKGIYGIEYFQEDVPLGTGGSLYLLKDKINSSFFVTNCDILINQDYEDIYQYHVQNKCDITIVSALKNYPIPYGIIETENEGSFKGLIEKPEYTFKINTGFYLLEPHVLDRIPEGKFFHITHLIEAVHEAKGKIGVFPVSEKSWTDIGNWEEYLQHIKMQ